MFFFSLINLVAHLSPSFNASLNFSNKGCKSLNIITPPPTIGPKNPIYFFQSNKFDVMVSIKLSPNVLVTHDWIPSIGSLLAAYNATPTIAI